MPLLEVRFLMRCLQQMSLSVPGPSWKGQELFVCKLDIKKAYDHVSWNFLIYMFWKEWFLRKGGLVGSTTATPQHLLQSLSMVCLQISFWLIEGWARGTLYPPYYFWWLWRFWPRWLNQLLVVDFYLVFQLVARVWHQWRFLILFLWTTPSYFMIMIVSK